MKNIWTYDEFIQTGTDFTDVAKVEAYDAKMTKFRNYKQEAEFILNTLNINSNDTLLDIGTGTGHFTIEAAKRCKKVYAIDVSKTMLEYAASRAKKENITNIEWINSGFLTLEFPDVQFDCAVSSAALHHLPDFWKMAAISNVYKSLKTGGKFYLGDVIFSGSIDEVNAKIDTWLNNFKNLGDNDFYSDAITHVKNENSTFSWILEGMFERTGFSYKLLAENQNFMTYLCTKK